MAMQTCIWSAGPHSTHARCPFTALQNQTRYTYRTAGRDLQIRKQICNGVGKDAVEGWIDLSKLVSGSGKVKTAYEDLSYKIGHDVYMDVSGWHLFLKEAKAAKGLTIAQALAQQFGEDISSGQYSSGKIEEVLEKVPIKLGGGKVTVSLLELMPSACLRDLEGILSDFEKDR